MNELSIPYSTAYDPRFATNTLMKTYQLEYEDGSLEERLDYSDWKFTSIIKRIKNFTEYKYNGVEKFTTIVFRFYGTTTPYRLVLAFNGFLHPYEIRRGTVLRMPLKSELDVIVANMNAVTKEVGRIVEVQK